eukprot:XP_011618343.1 PREDICTED: carbonic anhydrase 1-like [Takifugu rubripes]
MSHSWGYGANDGPDKWADGFPVANGPRQSPIDIVPGAASYDAGLKPLRLKYDPSTSLDILNNGHSFQVTFADDSDSSTLTEGPITGIYRLKQFHFHWGASDDKGSSHYLSLSPLAGIFTLAYKRYLSNLLPLQMAKFRSLLFSAEGEPECCMVNNYRPPQPLKGRSVRASFK